MSFRDLFTAKAETHSRKRRAKQTELIPAQVERLEARALLSAIVPGLNQHGILFTNANVAGRTSVVFDGSINSQISGNVNGAGLFVDINGNTGLRELTLTGLQARNNGSAGAVINLSNLQLDRLVISSSVFAGNGTAGSGAGLVLQLNNAQIGEILIAGSRFNLNEFDGLRLAAVNGSSVTSLRALNNRAVQNVAADGMAFLLNGSTVQNVGFGNNVLQQNGTNGFQLKLTNTPISNLIIRDNVADANAGGHGVFLDFIGSAVTTQIYRNRLTNQTVGDGMRIRTQFSEAGLRNINIAKFSVNVFEGNGGNGFFATLARDTTLRGQILRNEFRNNSGVGFGASAEDTENALDLQIGSLTRVNNELIHANTFDQNTGAAISLTLQDPSGELGDTTGRVRILGNTITGTQAGTTGFPGIGIHIRAIGSVVLTNGAARWSQVRIDGNQIRDNASHGVMFDLSEDSQLVDATVGNNTGTKLRFDVDGDFDVSGQQIIREPNDGNVIEDNGGNGITILRRDSAVVRDVRIFDNVIRRNENGIGILARSTYEAVPTAAKTGKLVTQIDIRNNQLRENRANGLTLRTEADAVLLADVFYNFIDGNGQNGIWVTGLENNDTDFENVGGTWIKNRISDNAQNGIAIQTVVGTVHPLLIGLDGFDSEFEPFELRQQSLGNYIFRNGLDGIDVTSIPGLAGTIRPIGSLINGMSIVNNDIVANGQNGIVNGVPDPLTAGKGIDVEVLQGRQGGLRDLREFRIDRNRIQGNVGDGLEIRSAGGVLRMIALGNTIDLNGGRGVDILNQTGAANWAPDTHVLFGDPGSVIVPQLVGGVIQDRPASHRNIVRSNGLEGFYVVNTSSATQTQDVDSRDTLLADGRIDIPINLMMDLENNEIRDNGRGIPERNSPASTLSGAGLVVRVGTAFSAGFYGTVPDITGEAFHFSDAAAAGVGTNASEFGNGRVNARVVDNDFSGNAGDDLFMESFTSTVNPDPSAGTWTEKEFKVNPGYDRDPLARMNMVFTGNTGDSLDVVRGFFDTHGDNAGAKYTNDEGDHKSRTPKDGPNPNGPFGIPPGGGRARNAQRVADRPVNNLLGALANAFRANGGFYSGVTGGSGYGFPYSAFAVPRIYQLFLQGEFSPNVPEFDFGLVGTVSDNPSDPNDPIIVTTTARLGVVEDATNANPSVLTSTNHGLFTGDIVTITGAVGNTAINGTWEVVRVNSNEFRLRDTGTGVEVAGNGEYSDFSARWQVNQPHRLQDGDAVTISGVTGNPNANGTHVVTVLDPFRFALFVPNNPGTWLGGTNFVGGTPVTGNGTTATQVQGNAIYIGHSFSKFHYDGIGPSTFRVESDWESTNLFDENQNGDDFNDFGTYEPTIFDGVGTIEWDPVDPGTFSYVTAWIDDLTVDENSGTATLTVHLSEPPKTSVQIEYQTADGSAVAGRDFVGESGIITFAAGQTSRTITISINPDAAFDRNERFYVDLVDLDPLDPFDPDLSAISGGTILDSRAIVTIQPDSDARPTVSISDTTVFPERGFAEFTVTLSNPSSETVFVDYATSDGTAVNGLDYLEQINTLMFEPNETTQTIRIEILPDTLVEPPETFLVTLSRARASTAEAGEPLTITDSSAVGTIFDTAFVQLPSQVFANGLGSGTSTAQITVKLSRPVPSGQSVTLNYTTSNGSATTGNLDYVATSGSVTIPAGDDQAIVSITVNRDLVQEGNEFFFVNFTDGGNAVFAEGANTQVRVVIREPSDVVGADAGGGPAIAVFDGPGATNPFHSFFAFHPAFRGGVRVATGDMNGDGFPDIIAAAGPGGGPNLRVFDGVNFEEISSFFALPTTFRGGVTVATGDVDGDGTLEIISGADAGGGPGVGIWDVNGNQLGQFFAFDTGFRGGVRVATGDVDGDGNDEIIVGSGPGQPTLVRVFDADDPLNVVQKFEFTAFADAFQGGVTVTAGDYNGDGSVEIVVGAGAGGGPQVRIFSGTSGTLLNQFFGFNPAFRGGVRVATTSLTGGAGADTIVVGAGPGGGPAVNYFQFNGSTFTNLGGYFGFNPAFRGGVFVAGRSLGVGTEGSPLQADTSVAPIAGPVSPIVQGDLAPIVDAALDRFEAAGLNANALEQLGSVEFLIADLGGTLLGLARPGVVLIDDDAAGYGWFVDYSPMLDEEFGRDGSGTLTATDSLAAGRMDLLTTVMHELGHELGWTDLDAGQNANDMMTGTLRTGVRRDLDSVFATEDLFDELLTA